MWITFKGKALSAIGTVTASGLTLETRTGDKDESILVLISRDLTAKGGAVDLAFRDKRAKIIGTVTVVIKPVPDPKGKPQ